MIAFLGFAGMIAGTIGYVASAVSFNVQGAFSAAAVVAVSAGIALVGVAQIAQSLVR